MRSLLQTMINVVKQLGIHALSKSQAGSFRCDGRSRRYRRGAFRHPRRRDDLCWPESVFNACGL